MKYLLLLLFSVVPVHADELRCLTESLYHEARGEPDSGILLVGFVILNRVRDDRWPSNICSVVHQPGQFSYYHDGRSDRMPDLAQYPQVGAIARIVYSARDLDLTQYGYFYKRVDSSAPFFAKLEPLNMVGNHGFFK